jgi:hypothetical protein
LSRKLNFLAAYNAAFGMYEEALAKLREQPNVPLHEYLTLSQSVQIAWNEAQRRLGEYNRHVTGHRC